MNDDDFADVRGDIDKLGFGALGGAGAEHHDSVKTGLSKDGSGIDNQIRCEKCGKTLVVTTPWPELIFMSYARLPVNNSWVYHRGHFMPNATCACGEPLRLAVTPDECQRHLKSGIAAQKIRPDQIQGFAHQHGLMR